MTVTATYLPDLSRVQVAFTGAPAGTDYAIIEKSLDGITWTQVRGGQAVPIVAGAGKVLDAEFTAAAANTYRVSYVDNSVTFVAAGTAATGNNASVVPAHPAGLAAGDVKVIWASIRNAGAGTVNVPAGWTKLVDAGNAALLGKVHVGGDTAPTVTFAGGVANADTIAQMAAFRNMTLTPTPNGIAVMTNPSGQNIFVPSIPIVTGGAILFLGWKQDDWTSVTTPTFGSKIGDTISTAGDDAGLTWTWFATVGPPTTPAWGGQTMTVVGGTSAVSKGATVAFSTAPFVSQQTAVITPHPVDADGNPATWLKVITRPSQNTPVVVTGVGDPTRPQRVGVFEVKGRTMPVAVTDLAGSRQLSITIKVEGAAEVAAMDSRLASGQIIFLQPPDQSGDVPTMYAAITGMVQRKAVKRSPLFRRYFDLDLTEVAAPAPTVTGITITWADVIATYPTWADVIAAKATWGDLIDSIDTGEVIVP